MPADNILDVGDIAPDFFLPATNGRTMHLYEALEKTSVVLFFYLRAFTPVCTTEVCSFREKASHFQELDAVVYGVSSDSLPNAQRFAKLNHLSYPLLSDANGKVRRLYQVPKVFGLLPGRSTYVIGRDRTIKKVVHSQLRAQTHVAESLQWLSQGVR
jgi:thioredoxin-dependent peroxiredoxin